VGPPNKRFKLTRLGWNWGVAWSAAYSRGHTVIVEGGSRVLASQLIWNDRCQARTSHFVDVSPPWGSESTVKAGRFDDESL
jgi:hypothetical protein